MMFIPGGSFWMGSDAHYPEEGPVCQVAVDDFWIDRTPVTNREFTRTLARVLHRPAIFHAPPFVLRAALGELASALIDGQRVLPALAEQMGFQFTHRTLEPALESMNL